MSKAKEAEGGQESGMTTTEKKASARSEKVQAAVQKAWAEPQPKALAEAQFSREQQGQRYQAIVGPVLRSLAAGLGMGCTPEDLPKVRAELEAWEPKNAEYEKLKCLLMAGVDDLAGCMTDAGVDQADDAFFVRNVDPNAQKANKAGDKRIGPFEGDNAA